MLILANAMLEETESVLNYPRSLKLSKLQPDQIIDYLEFLSHSSELVRIDTEAVVPISDPNDVHILQTAIAGKADFVCTLDGHFYEPAVVTFCGKNGIRVVRDIEILRIIRAAV